MSIELFANLKIVSLERENERLKAERDKYEELWNKALCRIDELSNENRIKFFRIAQLEKTHEH